MTRVVCIPGNGGGSGSDGWFATVKAGMANRGIPCWTGRMPDPMLARAEHWLPFMEETLQIGEGTVVVGHSSGTVAAMRYAETHRVSGLILVSAYHTDLGYEDEKASHYFDLPWQWEKIRENVGEQGVTVFASDNDPFIPLAESQNVADQLNGKLHILSGEGHFVGDTYGSKKDFPELLHILNKFISPT